MHIKSNHKKIMVELAVNNQCYDEHFKALMEIAPDIYIIEPKKSFKESIMSENVGIETTNKTMNSKNNECCTCLKRKQIIDSTYPIAKFDMSFMSGNLNRIISSHDFIVLVWIGEDCCGGEEGHEPKTYIVAKKSDFITVQNVIKTLIEKDFQVPCEFNCLVDIIPLVNPLKYDDLDSVNVFQLLMKHPDCALY